MTSRLRRQAFRIGTSLGLVATAATHVSPSWGQESTEPIRVEYRAPAGAGCPSATQFSAQVFARTRSARAAAPQETARTFIVELQRHGTRVTGSLVIQEKDGATTARRVNGSRCRDVATVLALATALAIDPRAELAPAETLDEPDVPPESPQTSPEAAVDEPSGPSEPVSNEPPAPVDDRAPGPASVSEHTEAEVEVEEPAEVDSGPSVWSPRWALGATASFGTAPRPAYGVSGLLELHRQGPGPAPIGDVGLELAYRRAAASSVRDAEASFHFYVARPTVCASAVVLGASLRIVPCVVTELGGVTGVGSEIPESSEQSRFWAAVEVQLRLELALDEAWFITLEGAAAAPLTRYKFVFENPDTAIHEVPALTATAALRIGRSF